tara:strand:+ start:2556 stop:3398 length:843 start_codon:yes stop_codon:yes gene_type:complete
METFCPLGVAKEYNWIGSDISSPSSKENLKNEIITEWIYGHLLTLRSMEEVHVTKPSDLEPEQEFFQPSLTRLSYHLRKGSDSNRIYILCHGYLYTGKKMMSWFGSLFPEECTVLAPNGPFPIPVKKSWGHYVGYSWYFFDMDKKTYFIDYEVCKDYLRNLVVHLGYEKTPCTLIGYSQGGYAAGHMAESLDCVDHLIGVGSQFKINNPKWNSKLIVDGLHGDLDETVDPQVARECFEKLPKSHQGTFSSFPEAAHEPTDEILAKTVQLALERARTRALS